MTIDNIKKNDDDVTQVSKALKIEDSFFHIFSKQYYY